MKLYIYDHCPYCVKARMIFGLKNVPFELKILLNDDEESPIRMVGQKMVPILEKDNGGFMPESMGIVHYVDQNFAGPEIIISSKNDALVDWTLNIWGIAYKLAMPRWIQIGLEEFKTQGAIDYFIKKKEAYMGSFENAMANSADYIEEANKRLEELNKLLHSENSAEGQLSESDIHIFPALRAFSVTKGIIFPTKVKNYMKNMSNQSRIDLHLDKAI